MKYLIVSILFIFIMVCIPPVMASEKPTWWSVQAIDTMKYSRDLAREKATDAAFAQTIDTQVRKIAQTGATHVAIATPYDEEFIPYLHLWVAAARRYNINVWFRGNFAGWEGWFEYASIDRIEHKEKLQQFLTDHTDLFVDGDIFTACPECENGGPGDPRTTGDVAGTRLFLIDEYNVMKKVFTQMKKNVTYNYNSMNGDVARLIMNPATTKTLGGVVVIDHYVATPQQLAADIATYATQTGGQIVLGEFGAPIPDLQGDLNEEQQAQWLQETLQLLSREKSLIGLNYWTHRGGSTGLWNTDGTPRQAVAILTQFYQPKVIEGIVRNQLRIPIKNALVATDDKIATTDAQGRFAIAVLNEQNEMIHASAIDYNTIVTPLPDTSNTITLTLPKTNQTLWEKLFIFLYRLISPF